MDIELAADLEGLAAAATGVWTYWYLPSQPADAPWEHPLPVGSRLLGRTLVSFYTQGRVVELDAEGRRTFEATRRPFTTEAAARRLSSRKFPRPIFPG